MDPFTRPGTTTATDLPVRNAAQPVMGEGLVLRSTDFGKTWQKLPNPPVSSPVYVTPHLSDPNIVFLTAVDGVYRTLDAGAHWTHVLTTGSIVGPDQFAPTLTIDPANPNWVFAAIFPARSSVKFWSSQDGGATWKSGTSLGLAINQPAYGFNLKSLWVDPFGTGFMAAGTYVSQDRGVTWTHANAADYSVPDPRHRGWFYALTFQGGITSISLSRDYGATWNSLGSPLSSALRSFVVDPDRDGTFYGIDLGGIVHSTHDNGATWQSSGPSQGNVPLVAQSRTCTNGGGLVGTAFSNSDFGQTWQPLLAPISDVASGPLCSVYAAKPMTAAGFVAKFAPGGAKLIWATYLGGASSDSASQITVDSKGCVYVAGATQSPDFPVTTGSAGAPQAFYPFVAAFDPNGVLVYAAVASTAPGFVTGMAVNVRGEVSLAVAPSTAVKFDANDGLLYAVTLPISGQTIAVASEASGSALYGGSRQGKLYRVSADGTRVEDAAAGFLGDGIYQMDTGTDGSIYVAAIDSTSPAVVSHRCTLATRPGDLLVVKLASGSLRPIYSTRFGGSCAINPQTLKVEPDGQVATTFRTGGEVPLVNPFIASPFTGYEDQSGAALFDSQGFLVFSTYLGGGDTVAAAGAIYVAVGTSYLEKLPIALSNADIRITGIFDAFSGLSAGTVTPGALMTITGSGLASDWIDLGLNDGQPLPLKLGGVGVTFNSTPASILQVAPDHIIFVVPPAVASPYSVIQVQNENAPPERRSSEPMLANTASSPSISLLTRQFPALPLGVADGNIRNADGSPNDATHPAAKRETVTMFGNGVVPGPTVSLAWDGVPTTAYAYGMPGFIPAIYAIDVVVPSSSSPGKVLISGPNSGISVYVK